VLQLVFPREGLPWNFGGAWKIHKRFLSESSVQPIFAEGRKRQRGEGPCISVFFSSLLVALDLMDVHNVEKLF